MLGNSQLCSRLREHAESKSKHSHSGSQQLGETSSLGSLTVFRPYKKVRTSIPSS
jgi:hypothetical protein